MVIRGVGYFAGASGMKEVVIKNEQGTPITVADVGRVVVSHTPRQGTFGHGDSPEAVQGVVFLRRGENPSVVLADLKRQIAVAQDQVLPKGMRLEILYDRSRLVDHTLSTEPLPKVLTLERALELLRTRSPRSVAERARIDVAASERVAARVHPNPSLSYGGVALVHGVNTGAAWLHQIVVEQPLLIFGQRTAREQVADLNVNAERARVAASLADRALAVRQAFAVLVAQQERVRILEESIAELSRVERIVRGRQQAGDRSVYDVARIQLETTSQQLELRNLETDVEEASGRLAALLGFPGWRPRAEGEFELADLPPNLERLWAVAERRRAEEAAARGGIALARRERLPIPAVTLGTVLAQRESSASAFFGVSLPLPLFDQGQGAIARTRPRPKHGHARSRPSSPRRARIWSAPRSSTFSDVKRCAGSRVKWSRRFPSSAEWPKMRTRAEPRVFWSFSTPFGRSRKSGSRISPNAKRSS
jgi:hypothetical protein